MRTIVEELKKNRLCALFWNKKVEDDLNKPIELKYEPIGEMGVYSKEYSFLLPYNGDDNRFAGLLALMEIKITSLHKEYYLTEEENDDSFYYNVKITIRNDKESIISTKFRIFSDEEPEFWGKESALRLFLFSHG